MTWHRNNTVYICGIKLHILSASVPVCATGDSEVLTHALAVPESWFWAPLGHTYKKFHNIKTLFGLRFLTHFFALLNELSSIRVA